MRSFGVVSWLVVSLLLGASMAPAWVSAATDDASPVAVGTVPVETVEATEPNVEETATTDVSGAAEGDVEAAAAVFGLILSPNPGRVMPSGSTLWTASFGGAWVLEIPKGLSIDLTFGWAATPDSTSCSGSQCSGAITVSGGTTVTQNYSAALAFGGQLLVSMPNPTAGGTYTVTATIYVTSNPSRNETRTVTFDVPAPTPTNTPTNTPTETPTNTPTETPTNTPTEPPTFTPTVVTPDTNTEGTVNIAKFYCNGIEETVFQGGEINAAAIPSSAGECQPGSATFTFYFIGDQTADHAQLTVDGTGTIGLPAGNYEVVEEGTLARTVITVTDGGVYNMTVSNPTDDPLPTIPADQGTVNIAKFYCSNITDVIWQSDFVDTFQATADIPSTPAECVAGTAEYAQIVVDGAGTVGLPDGVYDVVEEETQSRAQIEVIAGRITSVVVSNPMMEPTQTPTASATAITTSTPAATATATATQTPHHHPTKVPATPTVKVAQLPNTGNGSDGSGMGMVPAVLLLTALSGMLLAGAWELRRRPNR
ncbi:MAG: hypothetical protein QM589_02970 [Thermomicrobiales bacterium]